MHLQGEVVSIAGILYLDEIPGVLQLQSFEHSNDFRVVHSFHAASVYQQRLQIVVIDVLEPEREPAAIPHS